MKNPWIGFVVFLSMLLSGPVIAYYIAKMWFVAAWYVALFLLSLYLAALNGEKIPSLFTTNRKWVLKSFLFLLLMYGLLMIVNTIFPAPSVVNQFSQLDIVTILIITLIGPVAEEMAFRGYIQGMLRKKFNANFTIVLTALIFCLFHSLSVFPQIFVTAIILSFVKELSGSLLPSIVIHCLNNTVALVASVFV